MPEVNEKADKAPVKKAPVKKAAPKIAFGAPVNAHVDGEPSSVHRRVIVAEES